MNELLAKMLIRLNAMEDAFLTRLDRIEEAVSGISGSVAEILGDLDELDDEPSDSYSAIDDEDDGLPF